MSQPICLQDQPPNISGTWYYKSKVLLQEAPGKPITFENSYKKTEALINIIQDGNFIIAQIPIDLPFLRKSPNRKWIAIVDFDLNSSNLLE